MTQANGLDGGHLQSRHLREMYLRIKADYEGRSRITLLGVGPAGERMAHELRDCGLAAVIERVTLPRRRGPGGPLIDIDERRILIHRAFNSGRHVLVLDAHVVTGQRLRCLIDRLEGARLASVRTAVAVAIEGRRTFQVPLDYVGGVVRIAETN